MLHEALSMEPNVGDAEELANDIESQLTEEFGDGSTAYKSKLRSLLFNLKDTKNAQLRQRVVARDLPPELLVKMSPTGT